MPGFAHERAVCELRDHPELLSKLVRKVLSAELDPSLQVLDATVRFANPAEVRPDIVFLGQHPPWVIVEVQNEIDPDKRRRWLLAASILFNDHQAMGEVLVITASRHVARWAAEAASVQSALGTRLELRPVVLLLAGPAIEALLDPAQPELALFAAWAMQHRRGPEAKATVLRAIELTEKLPPPLRQRQHRAILSLLNAPMLALLQEMCMDPNKPMESRAFRRFRLELEALGEARGKAEGEARGKAEGKAEGQAEGKQQALLAVLSARELPASSAQEARIRACTDPELLDRWIRRAATATSATEALAPPRAPRKAVPQPARAASRRRTSGA